MTDLPTLCDRVIRWGLVALIAFTPLAFGSVEPWSTTLMEWGIVSLLLVFGLSRLWRPRAEAGRGLRRTGLELPVGLFLLFSALQAMPLPTSWVASLSPGSARMYRSVDLHGWTAIEGAPPGRSGDPDPLMNIAAASFRPVSVHARKTLSSTFLLACFALLFFLVVWWSDRGSRAVFLLTSVTVVGSLVAAFALVQLLTWNGRIYWVRKVPPAAPFGPFVNHNHYAGYVEMVIPVAISLVFFILEKRRQPGYAEEQTRWGKAGLTLFAAVLLVASLVLCMSRGGILSMLISGLVLFALVWKRIASAPVKWSIALVLPLLAAILALWIGAEPVKKGFGSFRTLSDEASFRLRLAVWEDMVRHVPDFLWVGSGLGTFEESYASVIQPGAVNRWDRAHNDYLQLLWETGVVGMSVVLAGAALFARRYWWPALRSRGHPLDLFRAGTAVALLSLALHSLVDFNLQIGANGFLFVLLAALLVSLQTTAVAPEERPMPAASPERPDAIGVARRRPGAYI